MVGLAVLLVDDQPALAEALSKILSDRDEVELVEVASEARLAKQKLLEREFDAALIDVRLGADNGIDLVRDLQVSHPDLPTVVFTAWPDPITGADAIWAGAQGFSGKDVCIDELLRGLATVAAGGSWFAPRLLSQIHGVLREQWEVAGKLSSLSARERDVLTLLVDGRSRAQIADTLYLSINTVRSHVRSVLRKLDVHSSLEAVGIALRAGIRPGDPLHTI